jgi:hypothetical protein
MDTPSTDTTTHTINISATNDNPTPLVISDDEGHSANTDVGDQNLTTEIEPGDIIVWVKGGDITSIDAITEKAGTNLFSVDPGPQSNGTWQGTVGDQPSETEESYSITYTVDGAQHTQDPKLKMH